MHHHNKYFNIIFNLKNFCNRSNRISHLLSKVYLIFSQNRYIGIPLAIASVCMISICIKIKHLLKFALSIFGFVKRMSAISNISWSYGLPTQSFISGAGLHLSNFEASPVHKINERTKKKNYAYKSYVITFVPSSTLMHSQCVYETKRWWNTKNNNK